MNSHFLPKRFLVSLRMFYWSIYAKLIPNILRYGVANLRFVMLKFYGMFEKVTDSKQVPWTSATHRHCLERACLRNVELLKHVLLYNAGVI